MLTINPEARAIIEAEKRPLYLDMPRALTGRCCYSLQESPTVRFGSPHDPENYIHATVDGIRMMLPRRFPMDKDLTLTVASFLGIRRLVVEGWCLLG